MTIESTITFVDAEQFREVERTLKTVIRAVEVLTYNFAENGDGRLGPAALPPSPPEFVRNETTVYVNQQLSKLMAAMHARRDAVKVERDRWKKLCEDALPKTADGEFVRECEKLYCPKCNGEVRCEYDIAYCDRCGNPDNGTWPPEPPLPLMYESCLAKPKPGTDQE